MQEQDFRALRDEFPQLMDQYWRLNNLYWIIDEYARRVKFNMREPQKNLWFNKWFWNEILKSRQHGFSTLIDLMALDTCLFNSNVEAGIIAHTLKDAQHIFETKIKYPYENLAKALRDRIPAIKCDANELRLVNNSWLRVATSMRSSTLRFLHISERGKICAKYPQKAEELKTGTLPALHEGSYLFDESTAEGGAGDFYEACQQAQADTAREKHGNTLSKIQCRFHFYAWHDDPKNATDPGNITISDQLKRYFQELKDDHGIELTIEQMAWYAIKRDGAQGLGRLMKREHPSFPAEAFEQAVEGAVFGEELERARNEGRIRFLPYDEQFPVYTFWDLGIGHPTAIGFVQFIQNAIHIIDHHEEANKSIIHHCKFVQAKPYIYAKHFIPHDGSKRDLTTGTPVIDTMNQLLKSVEIIPRITYKSDSIAAGQMIFNKCIFDVQKTARLIKCLSFYRYEWDENNLKYKDNPVDDWTADSSDMFQQIGLVYLRHPELRKAATIEVSLDDDRDYDGNQTYEYNPLSLGGLR